MVNNMYKLAGRVNVPADRKEEMNRYVVQLLDKCGIRKTEEMEIAGKKHTVVIPARPDENGIVQFDYSIFEKMKRETATYDINTCDLDAPDRGYNEFGVVINLIMTLQEIYTDGDCYLMKDDKPYDIDGYIGIIEPLLGTNFQANNRGRMWDMCLFLHTQKEYAGVTGDAVFGSFPWCHAPWNQDQAAAVLTIFSDHIDIPEECGDMERKDIASATHLARKGYLAQTVMDLDPDHEDDLDVYLKELLDADMEKRKELAKKDDIYGLIAETSLYMLPMHIVHIYACWQKISFWEAWDALGICGYQDILGKHEVVIPEVHKDIQIPLYKVFRRNSEDEFIEYWDDGKELCLSERMRQQIKEWQEAYLDMDTTDEVSMEDLLSSILSEIKLYGTKCCLVDRKVVEEFLHHGKDPEYKKALTMIRKQLDGYTDIFLELTKKQAIDWLLRHYMDRFGFMSIDAFFSLMGNQKKRMELFGF